MKRVHRGTSTVEFALVAPAMLTLIFGCMEFSRLIWTWQALQLAGDETARCVAISGTACTTPSSYAVTMATNLGAFGLAAAGVTVVNQPPNTTNASACNPPTGNTAVEVTLSLAFTSPASTLIPQLAQTLTTTSCYPLTGN